MQIELEYREVTLIEAALEAYRETAKEDAVIYERLTRLLKRFDFYVITAETEWDGKAP